MTTPAYRVSTGQRIGDVALALVLVPIAGAFYVFLSVLFGLMIAALVGVQEMPNLWVAGLIGGGVFTALMVFAPRPQWWWTIGLESDAAVLRGPFWTRRLPYDAIRFLRAGAPQMWRSGPQQAAGSIPLVIESTTPPTSTIHLLPRDAQDCLLKLHERSPRAVAVDQAGRSYLPSHPDEVLAARRRLAGFWRAAGRLAVAMGLLVFFPAVTALVSGTLSSREGRFFWQGLAGVPSALSLVFFGRGLLRKARGFDLPAS